MDGDGTALLAAIPDQSLLTRESADPADLPETAIWRLPISTPSAREIVGRIPASFFGMPRWSPDGAALVYLARGAGDRFRIMRAGAAGEDAREIDSGTAGTIDLPQWSPGAAFTYTRGAAGDVWRVAGADAPQRLSDETILAHRFVTAERLVYVALTPGTDGGYALRTHSGAEAFTTISLLSGVVLFDAVWVTQSGAKLESP